MRKNPLFSLICVGTGSCEVRRLNFALASSVKPSNILQKFKNILRTVRLYLSFENVIDLIICLLFCIYVRILIELTMPLGATHLNKALIDLLIDSVRACSEPLEIDDLAEVHVRSRLRLKSDGRWPREICGMGAATFQVERQTSIPAF